MVLENAVMLAMFPRSSSRNLEFLPMIAWACNPLSLLLQARMTVPPALARKVAVSSPIPELAPVMIATFSLGKEGRSCIFIVT